MSVLKWGLFKAERTSKMEYLSGPRPDKLGVVTGRLRNSIKNRVFVRGRHHVGELGTNVNYAKKHEEGIGIKARPFLQPSLERQIEGIRNKLEGDIFKGWNK